MEWACDQQSCMEEFFEIQVQEDHSCLCDKASPICAARCCRCFYDSSSSVFKFDIHDHPLPVQQSLDDDCSRRAVHQTGHERSTASNELEARSDDGSATFIYKPWPAEQQHTVQSNGPSDIDVHAHGTPEHDGPELESDRTSTDLASSRIGSSESSTVPQVHPVTQDCSAERPLDVQNPWSPASRGEPSLPRSMLSTPSRDSSNWTSSMSDMENESSSFFSCASTLSSSTLQFHECEEWIGCSFDDNDLVRCLPMRMTGASSGDWSLEVTPLELEMQVRSPLKKTVPEVVGSLAVDVVDRDKLVSRNGVFDSNNVGISEVANESASDLMTSSDEEQGCDMSYSDWMTKTSEDITVLDEPESDQEFCERRKPPMYEDTQPVSPSMDVDRENCLCPDKEGDPHAHDIYQRPRNTKSMESSTSQISRSSMGEDYFGFMDQVVGLTLQGIRGTASWTDFSSTPPHTPMSRLGEFDNSFDMHADDRPAATPEVALEEDQEVAEQASSISLSNVSHKSDISEGLTPEVSNPSLPRKAEKQEEVKGEGEEIVRNSFDSIRSLQIHSSDPDHSREPSLGYLAADNPAYRNRLSLDALPEYDLACWLPPEDSDAISDPAHMQAEEWRFHRMPKRAFLDSYALTSNQSISSSAAHLHASTDVAADAESWRTSLRTFTSYSDPPNGLEKSAKFRILSWFRKRLSFSKQKQFPDPKTWLNQENLQHSDKYGPYNTTVLEGLGAISLDDGFGDAVSSVTSVDDDFNFDDAEELNKTLRNMAEFQSIDMGTWTSQMIGFATPAKYYAHMANELEANGIDVLSAICKNLGVMHPLVQEIASILQKSVEELGTHLGRPPAYQKMEADEIWNHRESKNEWGSAVLSALLQCGINAMFFDRSPTGFESVSEYYSYISQKLRSEGVDIDCIVPKLVKRLGVEHPLMDALDKCVEIDPSRYFVNGGGSHSSYKSDETDSMFASAGSIHGHSSQNLSGRTNTPKKHKSGVKRIKDFVKKKVFNGGKKGEKKITSTARKPIEGHQSQLETHHGEHAVKDLTTTTFARDSEHCADHGHIPKHHRKWHSFSLRTIAPKFLKRSKPTSQISSGKHDQGGGHLLPPSLEVHRLRPGMDVRPGDAWQGRGYSSMDNRRCEESRRLSSEQAQAVVDGLKTEYPGNCNSRGFARELALATIFDHSNSGDESPRNGYEDCLSHHQRSVSIN